MDNNGEALYELVKEIKRAFNHMARNLPFDKTHVGTIISINKDGYTIATKGNSKIDIKTTATELETTVTNLLTKLDTLKKALAEIKISTDEVETVADEEILDTSEVVEGVHTKVTEIQTAISTLTEAIAPLQTALDTLMQKMGELDEVSLSNVIGAFGRVSSSESNSESNQSATGMDSSNGEDSTGSGLLGAIKAVDEAVGSVDNTESLLGKLQGLDDKTLENIIAQFGSEDAEEGNNLLSAANAVSNAIMDLVKRMIIH